MHADEVIGEGRVRDNVVDGRHMAINAALGWVHGTCRSRRRLDWARPLFPSRRLLVRLDRRGMTRQAFGLVVGVRNRRVSMWVVAGHAVEPIVALREATAPRQRSPLKANRRGIVGRDTRPARAVALGTQIDNRRAGRQCRPGDRQVGKSGVNRDYVVFPWSVTPLAADPMVRRSRSRRFDNCSRVCDMTEKAAADCVGRQGLAQILRWLRRVDRMPGSHIPERLRRGLIMREAQLVRARPWSSRPTSVKPRSPEPNA